MNKKWVNTFSPLYVSMGGKKIFDVLEKTIVYPNGEISGILERVAVQTSKGEVIGWMESKFLDPYIENLSKDCVDLAGIQTPDKTDAEQYIFWKTKIVQTNLCGQLSIARILNIPLAEVLSKWESGKPSLWKRVFGSGRASGTGWQDLIDILSIFGVKATSLELSLKNYKSPQTLSTLVDHSGIIVSVHIDGVSGRLRGQGVLHWCVIEKVVQERVGYGSVEIYNPFCNRVEVYSWAEFIASARAPYGIITQTK